MSTSWGQVLVKTDTTPFNTVIDLASNGITSSTSTVQMCTVNAGIYCYTGWENEDTKDRWLNGSVEYGGTLTQVIATN